MKTDFDNIIKQKPVWVVRNGLAFMFILIVLIIILCSSIKVTQVIKYSGRIVEDTLAVSFFNDVLTIDSFYVKPNSEIFTGDTLFCGTLLESERYFYICKENLTFTSYDPENGVIRFRKGFHVEFNTSSVSKSSLDLKESDSVDIIFNSDVKTVGPFKYKIKKLTIKEESLSKLKVSFNVDSKLIEKHFKNGDRNELYVLIFDKKSSVIQILLKNTLSMSTKL